MAESVVRTEKHLVSGALIPDAPSDIVPATEEAKQKYLKWFAEYATSEASMLELSRRKKITYAHFCKVLKWAAKELQRNGSQEVYHHATILSLTGDIKKLQAVYRKREKEDKMWGKGFEFKSMERINLMGEIRRLKALRAKVQGLLQHKVEIGDKNLTINVPNFEKISQVAMEEAGDESAGDISMELKPEEDDENE